MTADLLNRWADLATARLDNHLAMRQHGVNSIARQRLKAKDTALGARLHAVREELLALGIDPLEPQRSAFSQDQHDPEGTTTP